jgi:hypothetical protein
VSSRSSGSGVSNSGVIACFTARRIFLCDATLSDFSDTAVVIPVIGFFRFDLAILGKLSFRLLVKTHYIRSIVKTGAPRAPHSRAAPHPSALANPRPSTGNTR